MAFATQGHNYIEPKIDYAAGIIIAMIHVFLIVFCNINGTQVADIPACEHRRHGEHNVACNRRRLRLVTLNRTGVFFYL